MAQEQKIDCIHSQLDKLGRHPFLSMNIIHSDSLLRFFYQGKNSLLDTSCSRKPLLKSKYLQDTGQVHLYSNLDNGSLSDNQCIEQHLLVKTAPSHISLVKYFQWDHKSNLQHMIYKKFVMFNLGKNQLGIKLADQLVEDNKIPLGIKCKQMNLFHYKSQQGIQFARLLKCI